MDVVKAKLSLLLLLLLSSSALAKLDPQPYVTESGVALYPQLALSYGYDDNLALSEEEASASNILGIEAGILAEAEREQSQYQFAYQLQAAKYLDSSIDDYLDHRLGLKALWALALRHRLALNYRFEHLHEQRGRGLSEGIGSSLSELLYFQEQRIEGKYSFGAPQADGRIDLGLAWQNKRYTTLTETSQFRDWQQPELSGGFFYRVSSATELLFEVKQLRRRYRVVPSGEPSRDNDDTFLFVGAEWDITGKSTGSARVGYEDKRFKAGEREDFSGLSWLIAFNYLPVDHSEFSLMTSRMAKDPDQLGSVLDEQIYQLAWEHYWLAHLSSKISYQHSDRDYTGIERKENIDLAKLGLNHEFTRWLALGLEYHHERKRSSLSGFSYRQNAIFLNLTGTL